MSSAIDAAIHFLDDYIARATTNAEYRLPPSAALARMAGVSPVTMLKAVAHFSAAGTLHSRPGAGITLSAALQPEHDATGFAPRHSWQAVLQSVRHDILHGRYGSTEELPPGKTLCHAYGSSPKTMRRALCRLTEDGLLQRHAYGYRVRIAHTGTASSTAVLFTGTNTRGDVVPVSGRRMELFRGLERELARAGTSLAVFPYRLSDDRFLSTWSDARRLQSPAFLGSVRGFIVFTAGFDATLKWRRLLQRFGPQGRPMALLDTSGTHSLPDIGPFNVKRFISGFSGMGSAHIARHLISLGHRSVAFISSVHNTPYSRNRLATLTEAFSHAGLPDGVVPVTASTGGSARETQERRLRIGKVFEHVLGTLESMAHDAAAQVREALGSYETDVKDRILGNTDEETLRPLFSRALACQNVTAWVCVTDATGLSALRFLSRMRTKVPEELSICAYDNSFEASAANLSSFSFNTQGASAAIANFILGADRRAARYPKVRDVEIEGMLMVRGSSAKPVLQRRRPCR